MRLVQNSFAGGEIAPELFGRHDLDTYFHAAKSIKNFFVRKTGGLRKRAGTQLLWHVDSGTASSYRVFPYFYDRTNYAAVLFYKKAGSTQLFYRILVEGDDPPGAEQSTSVTTLASAADLNAINMRQIGDTLFFSRRGYRTVKGMVHFSTRTITWEEMTEDIDVRNAPAMTTSKSGFNEDPGQGFVRSSRTYGLIGVKNGVYSAVRQKAQEIWLYWVAGARVTVSFTPTWEYHDYYILAYQYGGGWGIISTFYPDTSGSTSADTAWANQGVAATGTVGGVEFDAGTTTPSSAWNGSPNATKADGSNTNAAIVTNELKCTFDSSTVPVLDLRIWFGGIMKRTGSTDVVDTVSTPGKTHVQLLGSSHQVIADWYVNAAYSESPQQLSVSNPQKTGSATYYVNIVNEDGQPVIVRDIVFGSDTGARTFYDENIQPGSTAGVMEKIGVGDSGMDVDIVDVWEQRLVMASSENQPFSLWFSRLGDVGNFYTTRPQTTADAFQVTIPVTTASRILHTVTSRWFVLFTESGEYHVDSSGDGGFGYNTITIRKTSSVGAHEKLEPVVTESTILFVAADGKTVYDMAYSLEQDNILPKNRSVTASHLTEKTSIAKIVYVKYPEPQLLCLLDDGTMLSLTYMPDQELFAWSHHEFGGGLKCTDINAPGSLVEEDGLETSNVVLMTFTHEDHPNEVWIERMRAASVYDTQSIGKAKCADHCGYEEADWPESDSPETNVEAEVVTLRPELKDFNSMGLKKNIFDCVVRLNRSGLVTIRPDKDGLADESSSWDAWASPAVDADAQTVCLVTKDVNILPRAYNNSDGRMVIRSDDGWPCEILSILYNLETGAK